MSACCWHWWMNCGLRLVDSLASSFSPCISEPCRLCVNFLVSFSLDLFFMPFQAASLCPCPAISYCYSSCMAPLLFVRCAFQSFLLFSFLFCSLSCVLFFSFLSFICLFALDFPCSALPAWSSMWLDSLMFVTHFSSLKSHHWIWMLKLNPSSNRPANMNQKWIKCHFIQNSKYVIDSSY